MDSHSPAIISAAEYKLYRDIKLFGFEMKAWQIGALPIGAHVCWCDLCAGGKVGFVLANPATVSLKYPKSGLPEPSREDALPDIKLEEEYDTVFNDIGEFDEDTNMK